VWGSCAAALDLGATPLEALYLVALASMFALIPSGPGYAGTQDAAAVIGIKAIGGTSAQAVSYVLLVRFVLFVPITAAGLLALVARYGGIAGLRSATRRAASDELAVDGPGGAGGVVPAEGRRSRSRPRGALAARTSPSRSSRPTKVARSASTSRSAGTSHATTGVPHASASTVGSPKPSSSDGKTSARAPE
jgi:hypothetical protein